MWLELDIVLIVLSLSLVKIIVTILSVVHVITFYSLWKSSQHSFSEQANLSDKADLADIKCNFQELLHAIFILQDPLKEADYCYNVFTSTNM